ncbi:MAG: 2-oxoglutarate dehydrogenase E1 subunit family protein, partial [Acidimicrobiales bacterium]
MADNQRSEASLGAFGANAWLVDDMFEQYRQDPSSVSESWQEFFADYRRGDETVPPPVVGLA